VSNLFGVSPRKTVPPMEAVALGAAVYAGMLAGEIPGRVMQAWQAKLGRLMEAAANEDAEATARGGWEWSDGGDFDSFDDDLEDEPPFAFYDNGAEVR